MRPNQLTHEQLLNAQFVLGNDGMVGSYDRRSGTDTAPCIFTDVSMAEEWFTAMCAVPTLYQQLYQQWTNLQACIDLNEKMNKKNRLLQMKLERLYVAMQNSIMYALRVATAGSEQLHREHEAEKRVMELRK